MSIAKQARMLAATIPDGHGGYINQRAVELNGSLYPDCGNCLRSFVKCECDPDDYQRATYQAMQDQKGKSVL